MGNICKLHNTAQNWLPNHQVPGEKTLMDQFWVNFQVIIWYFINIIRDIYGHNLVMFGN